METSQEWAAFKVNFNHGPYSAIPLLTVAGDSYPFMIDRIIE